jgi:protein TonB
MHALEDEPEAKTRGKRLMVGAIVAGGLAVTMVIVAQNVTPTMRILPEILEMAVVDDTVPPPPPPPPPESIPPPPPPPPPKKQKEPEPEAEKEPEPEAPPEEAPPEQQNEAPDVGLDSSSFASGVGGGGIGFRAGKTQMGDPSVPAAVMAKKAVAVVVPKNPPKLHPAQAIEPRLPEYPDSARRSNVEGYVLLEAEIDERGKLRAVKVRQGLQKALDDAALASVQGWRFQPARLEGRAVPSTKLIRIKFELN